MVIKFVSFDLGGTLVVMRRDLVIQKILASEGYNVPIERIHETYYAVENQWLEKYGMTMMTEEQAVKAYGELNMAIVSRLGLNVKPEELRRLKIIVSERWVEVESSIPPKLYPDSIPTLNKLKEKGYKIGIISNAPPSTIESVKVLGLDKYADPILISGIVGLTKPNPEIFKLALRLANVKAQESVHVGDVFQADIVGARNAGMEAILIDRDGTSETRNCKKVKSLLEVPEIITNL